MSRRNLLALGAAVLLGAVPALALANRGRTSSAGTAKHRVNFTTIFDAVTLSGPQGAPGTRERDAGIRTGTIDGKSIGTGAIVDSGTWGEGLVFTARGVSFDTHGSVNFTASIKASVQPNGGLALKGTLAVHGGSGRYKLASGTLPITGSAANSKADPDSGTFHTAGTARF